MYTIPELQIKIDELDDWLKHHKGHHTQIEVAQNKAELIKKRDAMINEIEVIVTN